MENPLKKILVNKEVPKALKEKVLNDIELIKLSFDPADLLAIKCPDVHGEIGKLNTDDQ